jgi:hypothetical protein
VVGFAFDGMKHIRKAQVAQVAERQWLIRIVPAAGFSATDGERVLARLATEVSPRIAARIELVDDIGALPSGKYKWVVQEWRPAALSRGRRGILEPGRVSGAAC